MTGSVHSPPLENSAAIPAAIPATRPATEPDAVVVGPRGLSPSRAADFKTCPLQYRLRAIDRIPEPPTPATARGTLVHAVLDRLFDLEPADRSVSAATALLAPEYAKLAAAEPAIPALFAPSASDETEEEWLGTARALLATYFQLEDPQRLAPADRELLVETTLDSGVRLRGYVDRLDVGPNGDIRVVDYKTGAVPREAFEVKALFQLKFYALILWKTRGVVPRMLRLIYLRDSAVLDYPPNEAELTRFERTVEALWQAIQRGVQNRDFRANPSKLCNWCAFKSLCPAFDGVTPPFPEQPVAPEPVAVATERSTVTGDLCVLPHSSGPSDQGDLVVNPEVVKLKAPEQ